MSPPTNDASAILQPGPWLPTSFTTALATGDSGQVSFAAEDVKFEYLLIGEPLKLAAGRYRIEVRAHLEIGASVVGILDLNTSRWLLTFHMPRQGSNGADLTLRADAPVQIIITAANHDRPGPLKGTLESLTIAQVEQFETAAAPAVRRSRSPADSAWTPRSGSLLCYIHIAKTAGTSVSDVLSRNFPDSYRQFRVAGRKDQTGKVKTFDSPDRDIAAIIEQASDPAQSLHVVAGHMPYGIHRKIGRKVGYLSFLREPLDRAVSWYYHVMDETRDSPLRRILLAHDFDFRQAIESGAAIEFNNDQTRMLTGSDKIDLDKSDLEHAKALIEQDYVFVGTSERLDECMDYLGGALRFQERHVSTLNVGRKTIAAPDAAVRELFSEFSAIDRKLYEWVIDTYLPRRLG